MLVREKDKRYHSICNNPCKQDEAVTIRGRKDNKDLHILSNNEIPGTPSFIIAIVVASCHISYSMPSSCQDCAERERSTKHLSVRGASETNYAIYYLEDDRQDLFELYY